MRRLFSLQAARALFGTVPRILIVGAVLVAYYLVSVWVERFVPWWVVTIAGLFVLAGLIFLGSVWLDRDIMRHAEDDSAADE